MNTTKRKAARQRGKCGNCAIRWARPGKYACETCAERTRRSMRAKTDARRTAGTCLVCDDPRVPGKSRCERHLRIAREARKAWGGEAPGRAAKIRGGVCISSGCEGTAIDYRKCLPCRRIAAEKKKAMYAERVARGLCRCGRRAVKRPGAWCVLCRAKRRARRRAS